MREKISCEAVLLQLCVVVLRMQEWICKREKSQHSTTHGTQTTGHTNDAETTNKEGRKEGRQTGRRRKKKLQGNRNKLVAFV